jgi:hypothetical protein
MDAPRLSRRAIVLAVALELLGAAGCAQKTDWVEGTLVTVDVTGAWKGRVNFVGGASGSGELEMTLSQRGPKVTGSGRIRTQTMSIEGTVRGDVFSFSEPGGSVRGEATVTGDEMSGAGRTNLGLAGQPAPFRFTLSR